MKNLPVLQLRNCEAFTLESPSSCISGFSKEALVGFIYVKPVSGVHSSAKRPCPERMVPGAGAAGAQSKALGSLHTSCLFQALCFQKVIHSFEWPL